MFYNLRTYHVFLISAKNPSVPRITSLLCLRCVITFALYSPQASFQRSASTSLNLSNLYFLAEESTPHIELLSFTLRTGSHNYCHSLITRPYTHRVQISSQPLPFNYQLATPSNHCHAQPFLGQLPSTISCSFTISLALLQKIAPCELYHY